MASMYRTLILVIGILGMAGATLSATARPIPDTVSISPAHRLWLEEVDLLLTKAERKAFLALEKDYQRDGFIRRFWEARDPYPETERNEFEEAWYARLEYVRDEFRLLDEDRARITLLNGEPSGTLAPVCPGFFAPSEIWHYQDSNQSPFEFTLFFVKPVGEKLFRFWYPNEDPTLLLRRPEELWNTCAQADMMRLRPVTQVNRGQYVRELNCLLKALALSCQVDDQFVYVSRLLAELNNNSLISFVNLLGKIERTPAPRDGEWMSSLASHSTDLPDQATKLPATLELSFPGIRGSRTLVQGLISVPIEAATKGILGANRVSYDFELFGEILRDHELFESFRYRFDLLESQLEGETLPLVFQRALRPGEFSLILKLEDLHGNSFARIESALTVPKLGITEFHPPEDPETARIFAEAERSLRPGRTELRLLEPKDDLLTGMTRFDAVSSGDELAKVTFYLNGKAFLTKKRPPYSVELDLGEVPRTHTVRIVGFDRDGIEVTRDELDVNTGSHRFSIRLEEPVHGHHYERSVLARAEVETPEGQQLERVELYLDETLAATLFQPPFSQPILLDENSDLSYVRAVAYLSDGNSTEDVVFVNSPAFVEEVDVQMVELYTSVVDSGGHPIEGLSSTDFSITEDGVEQRAARFEVVRDLPIHTSILLDASASMETSLGAAREAALAFVGQILTEKDRTAVVTFNQRPDLAVSFTNDVEEITASMASLNAAGGTALWDSLIFTLYYFNGVSGQRAILLLSDGDDESSRHSYKQALTYAQTAGVAIYAIGLDLPKTSDVRFRLNKLAEQTGGRTYYVKTTAELDAVYAEIQRELRSKYLLAYQSSSTRSADEFRSIEVVVDRPGAKAKTLRGYFP